VSRATALVFGVLGFSCWLAAQPSTQLLPETDHAFDEYIKAMESQLDWRPHVTLDPAGIKLVPGAASPTTEIKGAIIHDWRAAVLAPRATVESVIAVLQSYADYKRLYAPQISDSTLLSHEGDVWRVRLQLYKKKLFTARLDSEYVIEYRPLGPGRWAISSHSTKVAEIDGNRELPVGQGHGYLWRLNAYWLLEQRPEGVYIECRSISMSRDIPTGLGWAMKPMVTSVPRESLRDTLEDTIRALQ